jgi:hypothetical protein
MPWRYYEPKSSNIVHLQKYLEILFIIIEITKLHFQASRNKFHCNNVENVRTKNVVVIGQQGLQSN